MKHFFLYILFSLFASVLVAQNYRKAAERQFMQYTRLVIKKDFRAAADFIIEDFFELIPKEQMITTMETIFTLPGFDYSIDAPRVLSVSRSRKIERKYFLKLLYANTLRMKFHTAPGTAPADSGREEGTLLKAALQSKFGEKNVTYAPATGYYHIYSEKKVLARSPDRRHWKFIVLDEDKLPLLKKIIPEEMLE